MNRGESRDEGQAATELALALPLVALLLLALIQVGLVVRAQVLVVHAAREAARRAAVEPTTDAARSAALSGSGLAGDRTTVELVVSRDPSDPAVRASVRYRFSPSVPLIGPLVGELTLDSQASMRLEDVAPSKARPG